MRTPPEYGTSAKDYLQRAEDRLLEKTPEAMFYAALELRCGIERRMKQYLDAQSHIAKAKKRGWEIAKLAKGIEEAFSSGDQIVEFAILDKPNGPPLAIFLYTPVTKRLQKLGQQFGNYLHPTVLSTDRDTRWWADFQNKLVEATYFLKMATLGELLGAPLLHKKTNRIHMSGEFKHDDTRLGLMENLFTSQTKAIIRVGYHPNWKLEPVT